MAYNDPYISAPAELKIGDHSLLGLTVSCTQTINKGDSLLTMKQISWAIRYAFICGMQRGAADANACMEAILKRLPEGDSPLPGTEAQLRSKTGAAR